jgi:hypothetical protein
LKIRKGCSKKWNSLFAFKSSEFKIGTPLFWNFWCQPGSKVDGKAIAITKLESEVKPLIHTRGDYVEEGIY